MHQQEAGSVFVIKTMGRYDQDKIEKFILENRHEFSNSAPPDNHMDRFFSRLNKEIRKIISIVPYIARVAIVTAVIFTTSIIVWNNYLRHDRHYLTLKYKITIVLSNLLDDN